MNRKHKNKHNKPPNPVPPQKPASEEIIESEPKVDERVPEVIPDVKPLPLDVGVIEPEEDFNVPKKPKRKKDEKKLEDKLSDVKNIETEENDKQLKLDDHVDYGENSEIVADKGKETENIAVPNSRKKKGKNKKITEQIEIISKPVIVEEVNKKVNIEEKVKEDTIDFDSNLHNVIQSETTPSKKKNKNKKNKKDEVDISKEEDTHLELLTNPSDVSEIKKQENSKDIKDSHLVKIGEISKQPEEPNVKETTDSEKPSHQRKNKKSKAEKKHQPTDNLGTTSKQEGDVDVVKCEHSENPTVDPTIEDKNKNVIPSSVIDSEDLLKCVTVLEKSTDKVINIEPIKVPKKKGNNNKHKDNLLSLEKDLLVSADDVKSDKVESKNDSLQSCVDLPYNKDVLKPKQSVDKYCDQALIPETNINLGTTEDTTKSTNTKNKHNLLADADPKIDQSLNPLQEDLVCQGATSENKDSDHKEIDGEISKCKRKNKKNKEQITSLQKDSVPNIPNPKGENKADYSSDLLKENLLTENTTSGSDVLKVEPTSETRCDNILSSLESKISLESESLKSKKKSKNKDNLSTLQENTEACAKIDQTIDFLSDSIKDDKITKDILDTSEVLKSTVKDCDEIFHVGKEKNDKIDDNLISKRKNKKDKKHVGKEHETLMALNIVEIKDVNQKQTEPKDDTVIPQTSTKEVTDCSTVVKTEIPSTIAENKSSEDYMVISNRVPEQSQISQSVNQQSLIDSNNNTVMAELGNQTLTVPVIIPDTPLVVGLKPIKLGDILVDDKIKFQVSEPKPVVFEKITEKTDLKSKVMEVNKDMEELRISIEKSLAELTAMDRSEEIPELVSIVDTMVTEETSIGTQVPKMESMLEKTSSDLINKPNLLLQDQLAKAGTDFNETLFPSPQSEEKYGSLTRDKGKGKSKKKGKKDVESQSASSAATVPVSVETTDKSTEKDTSNKQEQKCSSSKESQAKTQQQNTSKQSDDFEKLSDTKNKDTVKNKSCEVPKLSELSESESRRANSNIYQVVADEDRQEFEPIEKFEDALTSSIDDINKSFELLSNEMIENIENKSSTASLETSKQEESETKDEKTQQKENPIVTHPKNLLGHHDIPVQSNRTDYKKERNKTPNMKQAKVKIKHVISDNIENDCKRSQHSQTLNKPRVNSIDQSSLDRTQENEEYVYKYSFRKVYLPHTCHVCKKGLKEMRVPCNFCNILFYCSHKHKDEDWVQHQALCFAFSTIAHLKGSKYIYGNSKNITGQTYRLLRMQAIVSCEKILKRRLVPWEQEVLLYPRICGDTSCREWKHNCLIDCEGCGQISYCKGNLDHFPKSHQRWCKSYALYQNMVLYQQTNGRLEPPLPTKVISNLDFELPEKINELLATLYEEKIDMDELQYAALTQMATAPLTAAYCHQVYLNKINSTCANGIYKKSKFVLHVVGAELQFEADSLNKWEIFFLHLKPELKELRVILVGPDLNPSNLPLDLLAKTKLCENCIVNKRRVIFSFHDKEFYHDFTKNLDFTVPDLVCAFNPSLNRSIINGKEPWISSINAILKMKIPLCITGYTPDELPKDLSRIRTCAGVDFRVIAESAYNPYASVRPDRNFISDDEMPLLFKNYCYMILCGTI